MNEYEMTATNLKYISEMAKRKERRFFRINKRKIEDNIVNSKMSNDEKNFLIKTINDRDFHTIFCYAGMLQKKYEAIYKKYNNRMNVLFMTIEDKTVFYA